jgi:hypothetical protein
MFWPELGLELDGERAGRLGSSAHLLDVLTGDVAVDRARAGTPGPPVASGGGSALRTR